MRLLIEPFAGIAGDMTLAALFDLGLDPKAWETEMRKLPLHEDWRLELQRVQRHSIAANHVSFTLGGRAIEGPYLSSDRHAHHGHSHDHARDHHDHIHARPHSQQVPPDEPKSPAIETGHASGEHAHGRTFVDIRKLIGDADLAARAKERAVKVFTALGKAEAKLHGVALEAVHFHEVGSLDAILDIVGVCVGLELLGVDHVYTLPLPVGEGHVHTAHGVLPLPAPATLELMRGLALRQVDLDYELVTPTGAAIVAALAESAPPQRYRILRSGYGAGTKDDARIANFLRLHEIEPDAVTSLEVETVIVLETVIDDATPEWMAHALDRLRQEGALEAYAAPVTMKKGRQGISVTVICRTEEAARLEEVLYEETPTIGIRTRAETRTVLRRRKGTVRTPWGEVAVKIVALPSGRERAVPEYESCAELSVREGIPLWEVYRKAAAAPINE